MVCLGIEIQSVKATKSIPKQKSRTSWQHVETMKMKNKLTKMVVHKTIDPTRYFESRLLEILVSMKVTEVLNEEVKRDINWFLGFLNHWEIANFQWLWGNGLKIKHQFTDSEVPCFFLLFKWKCGMC